MTSVHQDYPAFLEEAITRELEHNAAAPVLKAIRWLRQYNFTLDLLGFLQ
jgi:hypothetical protein